MTAMQEAAATLLDRFALLGVDPETVTFDVTLRSDGSIHCRTHDSADHDSDVQDSVVSFTQIKDIRTPPHCSCAVTAAVVSSWCSDAEVAMALLAVEQISAFRSLLSSLPPVDGSGPRTLPDLLQLVIRTVSQRAMAEVGLGVRRMPVGPLSTAVTDLVADLLGEMDRTHAELLGQARFRALLRRGCRGRGRAEVWALLGPVDYRFGDDPEMRQRSLAWALVASWAPQCLSAPGLVVVPGWMYRHLCRYLPSSVHSKGYKDLPPEVSETALTLWRDAEMNCGVGDFDECVRTAVLLCR